jgi:CheY-like chemotaxis protein
MSRRILVIEDHEDNRQILRDLLTSANFEVIEAEDGEAGLAAAARMYSGAAQSDRCCWHDNSCTP